MNRGDVYWVDLNSSQGSEINKERPCVLVGATSVNQARRTVIVVPLSTQAIIRPPVTVEVKCLGKMVAAVCDQIRTVDKTRLKKPAGNLSMKDMQAVDDALKDVLALE